MLFLWHLPVADGQAPRLACFFLFSPRDGFNWAQTCCADTLQRTVTSRLTARWEDRTYGCLVLSTRHSEKDDVKRHLPCAGTEWWCGMQLFCKYSLLYFTSPSSAKIFVKIRWTVHNISSGKTKEYFYIIWVIHIKGVHTNKAWVYAVVTSDCTLWPVSARQAFAWNCVHIGKTGVDM